MRNIFFILAFMTMGLSAVGQGNRKKDSIDYAINFLTAQTKNQEAQASYYSKQTITLNIQFLTLLVSLSVVGFSIYSFNKTRSDEKSKLAAAEKHERDKQDEIQRLEKIKEVRLAAAEVARNVAEGLQSLTWFLWVAKKTPKDFHYDFILKHHSNMKKIYTDLAATQIRLAAHNKILYNETFNFVQQLATFDDEVSVIASSYKRDQVNDDMVTSLGEKWASIRQYEKDLPYKFSIVIEDKLPLE